MHGSDSLRKIIVIPAQVLARTGECIGVEKICGMKVALRMPTAMSLEISH